MNLRRAASSLFIGAFAIAAWMFYRPTEDPAPRATVYARPFTVEESERLNVWPDYTRTGNKIVGTYYTPGPFHWLFGAVRVHPVRISPDNPAVYEWLQGAEWDQLPADTPVYHLKQKP